MNCAKRTNSLKLELGASVKNDIFQQKNDEIKKIFRLHFLTSCAIIIRIVNGRGVSDRGKEKGWMMQCTKS